ncbi:MAG: DNA topoisomerase [Lachnospiraceae bacterium]|nr:DNA topoisomerase [Lachnospiraceae bacterium]
MKSLFITEKPSVAREFAKALKLNTTNHDGYMESNNTIITWCVGHLITMSYPDKYDPALKRWDMNTLPFLPKEYKYEVIPSVKKQYTIVSGLLNRVDVETIYVCTDSGREGEYIYRLVEQMAQVTGKNRKRVWIDSQTEEEVRRGIKEAKDLSEYDNLAASAYLRAKEDYLMGINFSRALTLKYGWTISNYMNQKKNTVIAVGRVMTCVLGMIVRREREIRAFIPTPFYRILGDFIMDDEKIEMEWRVTDSSQYNGSPYLYRENGLKEEKYARQLIDYLIKEPPVIGEVLSISRKKEKKYAPLLFNLAELQNTCSKMFKISPDQTLKVVQELYEKKLVTYPRTDARVLSTAVAKEIYKNIRGLTGYAPFAEFATKIIQNKQYQTLTKTRYVNDKQITDHYAIIPTGQGLGALCSLNQLSASVYMVIVRRFLSIFYPPAVYQKINMETAVKTEHFFASTKILLEKGYLEVANAGLRKKEEGNPRLAELLSKIRKGKKLPVREFHIKEGTTTPPKRYNSGSMVLAMENAGQLIEDEELRAQIKGSGIGTSATRAEIIKKLVNNKYITLNKKTQILTPTQVGEMIYDVCNASIRSLLNPELTASWEKGLTYVAEGSVTEEEYMRKLEKFVTDRINGVRNLNNQSNLQQIFDHSAQFYKKKGTKKNETVKK